MKQSLPFSLALSGSSFPASKTRQPVTALVPHPYPRPVPDGDHPAVSPDGADGSDADGYRSDTLALHQGDWGTKQRVEPIDIAGYSLMAAGLIGGLYKLFTA